MAYGPLNRHPVWLCVHPSGPGEEQLIVVGQAEPKAGMFPGASEPVGGAGTWANRAKKQE